MERTTVKEALIRILQGIQASSHLYCPPITGTTQPIRDLETFDSKIWPVAIGMLSVELGVPIPKDVNIFRAQGGKRPLSIDESAALVCDLATKQGSHVSAGE